MQKVLVGLAAFVIGAALGMGLLVAVIVVAGYIAVRRGAHASGIGFLSAGVGHWTVLAVPVLCGGLLAWRTLQRASRIQR